MCILKLYDTPTLARGGMSPLMHGMGSVRRLSPEASVPILSDGLILKTGGFLLVH